MQAGAKLEVIGADIASSGANGILVTESAGEVIFRQMNITNALSAGVSLLQSESGFQASFQQLSISLNGANATGFLAATNNGAGYNILVDGPANTIRTASTTAPAVSIEYQPTSGTPIVNGAPIISALFSTVSSQVPASSNDAMLFGPSATGTFTVSGSFTVASGTPGSVSADVEPGGVSVIVPP
jgi:hypothetical protein